MSDISFQPQVDVSTASAFDGGPARITETYWGYVIKSRRETSSASLVLQAAAFVFGAGFAAAALGFWMVPTALVQTDTFLMRGALSVFCVAFAYVLISYARRTGDVEWQFDLGLGEVRKVSGSRGGKGVLLAQLGFDAIHGFKIVDETSGNADKTLALILHDGSASAEIARGAMAELTVVSARLRADFIGSVPARTVAATPPSR